MVVVLAVEGGRLALSRNHSTGEGQRFATLCSRLQRWLPASDEKNFFDERMLWHDGDIEGFVNDEMIGRTISRKARRTKKKNRFLIVFLVISRADGEEAPNLR